MWTSSRRQSGRTRSGEALDVFVELKLEVVCMPCKEVSPSGRSAPASVSQYIVVDSMRMLAFALDESRNSIRS